ncbi:MAG: GcrA family cell cycle regulator [Devosia sp.]|jgi:GcrA cell cycle regulator|nr:GcrA family cell cycle regulator [Devosiaceae bacterium]
MGWTEERVELLKKLWMEGFSASQIANELGDGVTRNAVIGKVHRLKLSGRAKPASAAPRARSTPRSSGPRRVASPSAGARPGLSGVLKARQSMGAAPVMGATALKISEELEAEVYVAPQVQELFIPVEQRLTLLQLNEHTCKWPIGDPLTPDFYFCGQHSEEGKPYCEFHSHRAYHQIEKKKR